MAIHGVCKWHMFVLLRVSLPVLQCTFFVLSLERVVGAMGDSWEADVRDPPLQVWA